MGDVQPTIETKYITAHGTTTLEGVYTNEKATVERTLARYEQWLTKEKKYRFVGLDLEYTIENEYKDPPQELAVVQIAMHVHILVYHYCRPAKKCPALDDFFRNKAITFTSMDNSRDKIMLAQEGFEIPEEYYVDIQELFKIKDGGKRDSMGHLAEAIIDSSYLELKGSFPEDGHDYWERKPMPHVNLKYAARDGYISYELYHRILTMRDGLVQGCLKGELCPSCKSAGMGSSSTNKRLKGKDNVW